MRRYSMHILITLGLVFETAFAAEAPSEPATAPRNDLSRALGQADIRWNGVFSPFISDGAVQVDVADIAVHSDLEGLAPLESPSFAGNPTAPTPDSDDSSERIATTEYVQANIDALQPDSLVRYTENRDIRLDYGKSLLGVDSLDAAANLVRLDASDTVAVGDATHNTHLSSLERPVVTIGSEGVSSPILLERDLAGVVRYDADGDVTVSSDVKFRGEKNVDGELVPRNLIALTAEGTTEVGDYGNPLVLITEERPEIRREDAADQMAYLSDFDKYVSNFEHEIALIRKADLVGGKVPVEQLPDDLFSKTWDVETVADLVALEGAKSGDYARITTGADQGKILILSGDDPTIAENWLDITSQGNVVSVNGQDGVVTLSLSDFPDIQAALAGKANLASPSFSGTPKAPTAAAGTNTTQLATTAFVTAAVAPKANLASPAFTGTPTVPTAATATSNTQAASTSFVKNVAASYLPLTGGTLTGLLSLNRAFGTNAVDRIDLYPPEPGLYGIGLESGAVAHHAKNAHRWYLGDTAGAQNATALLNSKGLTLHKGNLILPGAGEICLGDSDATKAKIFCYAASPGHMNFRAGYTGPALSRFAWEHLDDSGTPQTIMRLRANDLFVSPNGGTEVGVITALNNKLSLTGGTLTGPLRLEKWLKFVPSTLPDGRETSIGFGAPNSGNPNGLFFLSSGDGFVWQGYDSAGAIRWKMALLDGDLRINDANGANPVYVKATLNTKAPLVSPSFSGNVVVSGAYNTATGPFMVKNGANYTTFGPSGQIDIVVNNSTTSSGTIATLASPAFTGVPTAPTAAAGTSNKQLATTAFVRAAMSGSIPSMPAEASGIGQWGDFFVRDGTNVKVPAGGTWAYFGFLYNNNGQIMTPAGGGVVPGGTIIGTGASGYNVGGFCWRIK